MLTGKHLIAGEWVATDASFASNPAHGPSHDFCVGIPALVDAAAQAAEDAFATFGCSPIISNKAITSTCVMIRRCRTSRPCPAPI